MINSQWIIGLDAGATHTKIAVWKLGEKIFQREDWPGMNMDLVKKGHELELFTKKLNDIREYQDFTWILAIAGLDDAGEIKEAEMWWRRYLTANEIKFKEVVVMSDIDLVIWSGNAKGVGVGLISGTGSNCLGIDLNHRHFKVGGMSHLMSDEGSGFALGWQNLRLITKMADGRLPKTSLYKKVMDLYEVKEITALKNKLLRSENLKAEVAKSSKILIDAATDGDQLAVELVKKEISELVEMVVTVNRKMRESGVLPLSVAGSLFKSEYYYDNFVEELRRVYPDQKISLVSPIEGVLNFAKNEGEIN